MNCVRIRKKKHIAPIFVHNLLLPKSKHRCENARTIICMFFIDKLIHYKEDVKFSYKFFVCECFIISMAKYVLFEWQKN